MLVVLAWGFVVCRKGRYLVEGGHEEVAFGLIGGLGLGYIVVLFVVIFGVFVGGAALSGAGVVVCRRGRYLVEGGHEVGGNWI